MDKYDLDTPLIQLISAMSQSALTLRHVVEGILIIGGIGSGKSSGSGRMIALKYLQHGFGGLVLCTKIEEKEVWQEYCRLTGREKDLIILERHGIHSFNFLEYESAPPTGEASTDTIVQVLKTIIRVGQEQNAGRSDDAFWETALEMLIANTIDLCKLAYGKISVQLLYDIVQSIPKYNDEARHQPDDGKIKAFEKAFQAAHRLVIAQIDLWSKKLSEAERERLADDEIYEAELLEAVPDARLLKMVDSFFNDTLASLSDKTRSIIDFTFSGFLFRLLREPVYSLFCRYPSTLTPEDSLRGKIILVNLPVKAHENSGQLAQTLFKYCWQRAMEKRDIAQNDRPVFLFADECHFYLHEHDQAVQTTARSSRICTVYLTQNLPNLFSAMGGEKSEYKVKSFLGTLATKIFHANSDEDTNEYSSKLIGDAWYVEESQNLNMVQDFVQSRGLSHRLERVVRPEEFQRLVTGGPLNRFLVEGYLYRQGDSIGNGRNFIRMAFNQNYQP